MRSISIAIPEEADAKLRELARQQYRAPRQQAAVLLVEAINRAGARVDPTGDERIALAQGDKVER